MNRHISEQYDVELSDAKRMLMEMGGLVEQQLADVGSMLTEGTVSLVEDVLRNEARVNTIEVELDELCIEIIARRQPTASDLRTLISVMKAIADIERIGDEAKRIAKFAAADAPSAGNSQYPDVWPIHARVCAMLNEVLDAFARSDAAAALAVVGMDAEVDAGYKRVLQTRLEAMRENPESLELSLNAMWIARSLERIGDHVKNVGEYVVYLVQGKDVRHSKADRL